MTFESLVEPTTVAALIALFGAVLAALMASAGYLYRVGVDHRKGKRRVLYFLLEIRYASATALFDPRKAAEEYINHFVERLKLRGFAASSEDMPAAAKVAIANFFEVMVSEARRDLLDRLVAPYETALLEMAAMDPVTAYQLRGKEKMDRLIGHTRQYKDTYSAVVIQAVKDTTERVALDWLSTEVTDDALSELEKILNEDVLKVAAACGRSDRRKCQEVLNRSLPEKRYRFDEFNDYLDSTLTKLIDKLNSLNVSGVGAPGK